MLSNLKDRVYWFDGPLRKFGKYKELRVLFQNEIHQIGGNYLLYDMKEMILYTNSNFVKYLDFKHFSKYFLNVNILLPTVWISEICTSCS